jgi:hypothetical protein
MTKIFLAVYATSLGRPELPRLIRGLQTYVQDRMSSDTADEGPISTATAIVRAITTPQQSPFVISVDEVGYKKLLTEYPRLETVLFAGTKEEAMKIAEEAWQAASEVQKKVESGRQEQIKQVLTPFNLTIEDLSVILRGLSNESGRLASMVVESSVNEGVATRLLEEHDEVVALHVRLLQQLKGAKDG